MASQRCEADTQAIACPGRPRRPRRC